jgi:hypothetical protein
VADSVAVFSIFTHVTTRVAVRMGQLSVG